MSCKVVLANSCSRYPTRFWESAMAFSRNCSLSCLTRSLAHSAATAGSFQEMDRLMRPDFLSSSTERHDLKVSIAFLLGWFIFLRLLLTMIDFLHPIYLQKKQGEVFYHLCNCGRNFLEFKVATTCSTLESLGMEIPAIAANPPN